MWEKIKNNLTIKQIVVWSMLLITGVILFIIGLFNITYVLAGNAKNLNDIIAEGGEPKNLDVVELDVKYVLGRYAQTESGYRSFRTTTEHYIVVLDDGGLISIAVKDQDTIRKLNQLAEYTQDLFYGFNVGAKEPQKLYITGVIKPMSSNVKRLYEDALFYSGFDEVAEVYMYEIDTTKSRSAIAAAFIAGVLLIGAGIVYFKHSIDEKNMKKWAMASVAVDTMDPLAAMVKKREEEEANSLLENHENKEIDLESNHNDVNIENSITSSGSKFSLKKD